MRLIVPSLAAVLLLTLLASSRVAVAASESTCVKGGQQNPDIAARKTVLQRSPTLLGTRLELANLLEKAGCYAGRQSDSAHILLKTAYIRKERFLKQLAIRLLETHAG